MNSTPEHEDDITRALRAVRPNIVEPRARRLLSDLRHRLLGRKELPEQLGRFQVRSEVGRGAMGVVYAAHDPNLDRVIALKTYFGVSAADAEKVLAEAKCMGRIRHPHVVTVHDAIVDGEHVCVAMELVEGEVFSRWLRSAKRSTNEVCKVLLQSGRGLAAVHAAGLIHRDFKPSNIVVDDRRHAKVIDFGLALALGEEAKSCVAGTPHYMAPEVFQGASPTPRSDQYAFCVVAAEALGAAQRFNPEGGTTSQMASQGDHIPPTWSFQQAVLPPAAIRVLERGLSRDPARRFTDMDTLLEAFERAFVPREARRRARLWMAYGVAITLVALLLVVFGGHAYEALRFEQIIHRCERAAEAAAQHAWSTSTRDTVAATLTRASFDRSEVFASKTVGLLNDHANAWTSSYVDACTRPWGDPRIEQRAMWCLETRRLELEAFVASVASEGTIPAFATIGAASLRNGRDCLAPMQLEHAEDPPRDFERGAVSELLTSIAKVNALNEVGAIDAAVDEGRQTVDAASKLGWIPGQVWAHLRLGEALAERYEFDEALEQMEEGFFRARASGDHLATAAAATALATTVGVDQRKVAEGRRWLRHAEIALAELPSNVSYHHRVEVMLVDADLSSLDRAYERAFQSYSDALDVLAQNDAEEDLFHGAILNSLGLLYQDTGKWEDAKRTFERARSVTAQALGNDHPNVAAVMNNLASVHFEAGETWSALVLHEQSLALERAAHGDHSPRLAANLAGIARVHGRLKNHERAKAAYQEALDLFIASVGPDHHETIVASVNLSTVYSRLGEAEKAGQILLEVLPRAKRVFGERDPSYATILSNAAEYQSAHLRDFEAARQNYLAALSILDDEPDPIRGAIVASLLALAESSLGDHEVAERRVCDAMGVLERRFGGAHPEVGKVRGRLAAIRRARAGAKDVPATSVCR